MTEHNLSPYLGDADMRRISNSEAATWLTCRKKYYYEFDLNVEPRKTGQALGRGVLLHDILALYYERLKNGCSHNDAVSDARARLMTYMSTDMPLETITEVDSLLKGYWNFYQGDPDWEIIAVEQSYDLPMTGDYEYTLRLDLLVRVKSSGKFVLVDHKTAYDFWSADDLDLNPQFPKYIGSLRANGITVDYAILNQIRTRKLKAPDFTDLFKRVEYHPSRDKISNALREQIVVSEEIIKHRMLPLEVRGNTAPRILNKQVCKYCDSKPLCMSEYDGGEIKHMLTTDYRPRTYGYNETEVAL